MQDHSEKSMVDLFVEMEQTLPVNTYDINGVNAWPYIRLSIKNKIDSHFLVHGGNPRSASTPSFISRVKLAARLFGQSCRLVIKGVWQFPWRHYFSKTSIDILMFCFNSAYMRVGEKEINRNLIGMVDGLQKAQNQRFYIWEYTAIDDVKSKPDFPGLNITPVSAALNEWCRFRIAFSDLFPKKEWDFVTQINIFLEAKGLPVRLESHKLFHEMQRIITFSQFLRPYLVRHNVKKVINVCYYSYVGMAVNLACYREKRLSIEYQHGVQTEFHPLYSNWSNVPEKGYALLPEAFWLWGEATYQVIHQWAQHQRFHVAKIVGNAWLPYFSEQIAGTLTLTPAQQARYANKTLILVSLQAFPEHYRTHVTEAMKQSDDNWLWVLKEHPRYLLSDAQLESEFGTLLQQGKVIVERDFSLYEMLSLISFDVHLTAYSTVAFECEYYGIPTIFFHENGVKGNATLLEQAAHFYSGLQCDELLRNMQLALNIDEIQPIYMAKDVSVVDALLLDKEKLAAINHSSHYSAR
ncbi:hypothetical protein [Alteromonas sp. a30]|uniref:hypothetical protein n=1 Tax=Alteromonas sp. a30 TaxID=2730917 RepID=UPI0022828E26|nr:hypothetical protein [Alteromonas sp. a30]MCY7296223.1 hypothetical protein [Alteromonas sp. a30]